MHYVTFSNERAVFSEFSSFLKMMHHLTSTQIYSSICWLQYKYLNIRVLIYNSSFNLALLSATGDLALACGLHLSSCCSLPLGVGCLFLVLLSAIARHLHRKGMTYQESNMLL